MRVFLWAAARTKSIWFSNKASSNCSWVLKHQRSSWTKLDLNRDCLISTKGRSTACLAARNILRLQRCSKKGRPRSSNGSRIRRGRMTRSMKQSKITYYKSPSAVISSAVLSKARSIRRWWSFSIVKEGQMVISACRTTKSQWETAKRRPSGHSWRISAILECITCLSIKFFAIFINMSLRCKHVK